MFSAAFVCLLAVLQGKHNQPIFAKFDGKVTHRPRKKCLDFGVMQIWIQELSGGILSQYQNVSVLDF